LAIPKPVGEVSMKRFPIYRGIAQSTKRDESTLDIDKSTSGPCPINKILA